MKILQSEPYTLAALLIHTPHGMKRNDNKYQRLGLRIIFVFQFASFINGDATEELRRVGDWLKRKNIKIFVNETFASCPGGVSFIEGKVRKKLSVRNIGISELINRLPESAVDI